MTRPSMYQFAGGDRAFLELATAHHRRCLADPELNHPFSHPGHPDHVARLGRYWAEVFGGPRVFSRDGGGHSAMLTMHAGMGAGADLGARFVDCFVAAADDAGLPGDREFRTSLRAYMEWAVAQVMSYDHPGAAVATDLPMPRWDWDGLEAPAPARHLRLAGEHLAANYSPLPVVIASGEGAWVRDVDGRRYLDCLAAYSAVNFGHGNPVVLAAARTQLERLTLTSRAFHNDQLGPFAADLAALTGKDLILPMNTGAEAVETAVKVARKWGYDVKGVAPDDATILVASGNFHGRTTTIVGFSDDPDARTGFGPFTPGFRVVTYGDAEAAAAAMDDTTVAVLLEPIQGEAGVVIPPAVYLPAIRELCDERRVLLIADEVQSGLGRTGTTFACDLTGVVPDVYVPGKALGGGVVPVSAVAADRDVLSVIGPGQHGSTFGGNPFAAAVGRAVVGLLASGEPQRRAAELGPGLYEALVALTGQGIVAVRGVGLWAGIDIDPALGTGREVCERLLLRGVLAKDTHGSTIRFAPPLVVTAAELDWAVEQLAGVLADLRHR